jgi:hypothetical protein
MNVNAPQDLQDRLVHLEKVVHQDLQDRLAQLEKVALKENQDLQDLLAQLASLIRTATADFRARLVGAVPPFGWCGRFHLEAAAKHTPDIGLLAGHLFTTRCFSKQRNE